MNKASVWKYPLGNWETGMFSAEMPRGAEVLSLQWQHDELCMWALVNPDAMVEQRHFIIVGTGHEVTGDDSISSSSFVGTFQYLGGDLIFHVFEVFRDAAG